MEKKNKRKIIIASLCMAACLSYYCYDVDYNPQYEILAQKDGPFGRYSNGLVYIGTEDYIHSIKNQVNENDILIIVGSNYNEDTNKNDDPNVKILSSYEIDNPEDRLEILNVLEIYSKVHETEWQRSVDSMRVEWTIHNILYDLHYKRERTKEVDLNNSEEEFYSNTILQRIIK